jgi:hypothetical protein
MKDKLQPAQAAGNSYSHGHKNILVLHAVPKQNQNKNIALT